MAKTKIKVTMYEQRYGSAVMTEEEYQAMFKKRVEEIDNDEDSFEEWLNDEFTAYEVFSKSETEIKDLFHKANIEYVEEELSGDWVEIEKEITVDLSKAKTIETDCRCPYCGKK
jgi:phosphopantetheinyl transferase (holo-ACP synthase)